MEKLTHSKRLQIIGYYLRGMAYDEIAAKAGVSKATVSNVIAELRAGNFKEAAGVADQLEQLRELAVELRRTNLTPGRCAVGITILNRINECGLDPADIDLWPDILKSVRSPEEVQEFVEVAYSIGEIQKKTGLSLDLLGAKVHELEKKRADLEPVSNRLAALQQQVTELARQRDQTQGVVNTLEDKRKLLDREVRDLDARARTLSRRIHDKEARADKAEATLDAFSKERQRLESLGFTFEGLAEFAHSVKLIAKRRAIEPAALRARLCHELENLDQALGLEALVDAKQRELTEQKQLITQAKQELATTKASVANLKQEKAKLEGGIKTLADSVLAQMGRIVPTAQKTMDELAKSLRGGVGEVVAEVRKVRDESIEVGKNVGRLEGTIEANAWLKDLIALVRNQQDIDAKQVRGIVLAVCRGFSGWLKVQDGNNPLFRSLTGAADGLIRELEQWRA